MRRHYHFINKPPVSLQSPFTLQCNKPDQWNASNSTFNVAIPAEQIPSHNYRQNSLYYMHLESTLGTVHICGTDGHRIRFIPPVSVRI